MEASSGTIGGSVQASLGGRYALALFELARDAGTIDQVEASLGTVRAALDGVEAGAIEVLADETSRRVKAALSGDPASLYPGVVRG